MLSFINNYLNNISFGTGLGIGGGIDYTTDINIVKQINNNNCDKLKKNLIECLKCCNDKDMFYCKDLIYEIGKKCNN